MRSRRMPIYTMFCMGGLALLSICEGSYAAKSARSYSKPNQATSAPSVDTSAAQQAQKEVNTARGELKKAQDDLASAAARLRGEMESSPEMTKAQADYKEAQAAYVTASKPTLDKVHESAEYKAAVNAKLSDETKIQELRASPGNEAQISTLAQDSMTQSAAASKLENDAIARDPTALTAKATMNAASAQLGKLRAQFSENLKQNADWQTAKKAVDDATQKLQTAEASYREEVSKLASAKK